MTEAATQALDPRSVLVFHPLARRDDGEEVVLGRSDSDVFVALPAIGARAVEHLAAGRPVGEVEHRIADETGELIDVRDLAESLVAFGLVDTVDGRSVPGPPPIRSTFPRLRTDHVRWLLARPVRLALDALLAAVVLTAVAAAVRTGSAVLDYRSLIWTDNGSVVLLTQALISWTLILVHETAHLATARAAGVPGRVEFGTRLQFLVAQTNVTGIWAAPLRHRLAVYAAGMKSDAAIGSTALLASAVLEPGGLGHRIALVVAVMAMTALGLQLLIFMRTDVYFIVQDLTRSRNLYGDGAAYARYLALRLAAPFRAGRVLRHPLAELAAGERRTIRGYTVLLAAGTALCLGFAAIVILPYNIGLIRGAVAATASRSPAEFADGLIVLALLGTVFAIWCRAWWSRHGHRIRMRRRSGA